MVKDWKSAMVGALPFAVAIVVLLLWKCQSDTSSAAARGVGDERLRVADSALAALRKDSAANVARLVRLRRDSAALATQATTLRATFQRDLARWQALAAVVRRDTVLVGSPDSLPTLERVIALADTTIASCRAEGANCEQRAANAEARVVVADSLWRGAGRQIGHLTLQVDIWRRRAQPSLWEQVKLIPKRIVPTATVAAVVYAACKAGG